MIRRLTIAVLLVWSLGSAGGCGGGSGNGDDGPETDNPPAVAGTYDCVSGCFGTCVFTDVLTVTQSGSDISFRADGFIGQAGTVFNDGSFASVLLDGSGSCEGRFRLGTGRADCRIDGITCQRVTFQRR